MIRLWIKVRNSINISIFCILWQFWHIFGNWCDCAQEVQTGVRGWAEDPALLLMVGNGRRGKAQNGQHGLWWLLPRLTAAVRVGCLIWSGRRAAPISAISPSVNSLILCGECQSREHPVGGRRPDWEQDSAFKFKVFASPLWLQIWKRSSQRSGSVLQAVELLPLPIFYLL